MGSCNTTQNERGGKDLLLKICEEVTVSTNYTADANQITLSVANTIEVGDLVRIDAANLGTIDALTADQLYFVKTVNSTTGIEVSATPGGTVIEFTDDLSAVTMEIFKTIGGLRTKTFSFAAEAVEVSNHGSNQWRAIKDAAGLKSVSVSGDGVYTNVSNFKAMEVDAFAQNLVCLAFLDVAAGRIYSGCFKITSLELSGEFSGEATYSMSAENNGEITIYQAA